MTNQTEDKTARAREQARSKLEGIIEMVEALNKGEEIDGQDPTERIQESALSVQVRSDWHTPGDEDFSKPAEYEVLLCTGGPACRIIGELDCYQQPDSAKIQYQDWFTPWEALLPLEDEEHEALLTYARQFYFS